MKRNRYLTAVATLLAVALAAGVSYAAIPGPGNVYSACMLKGVGTIRLIDKSLPESNLMSRCKPSLETEVSWNQAGQPGAPGSPGREGQPGAAGADGEPGRDGADGVSVTSAAEPAGANCANGGSKFTAANDVTYACNGASGDGDGAAFITREVGPADVDHPQTAWVTLFEDLTLGRVEASCAHSSAGSNIGDRARVRWTNTSSTPKLLGPGSFAQPGASVSVTVGEKQALGMADEPGLVVEWIENHRYHPLIPNPQLSNDYALFCQVYVWVTPHT